MGNENWNNPDHDSHSSHDSHYSHNGHHSYDNHDIPVKEISELLEVASKKVPELISNVLKTVYSEEAAVNIGKSVGGLYKELTKAGIPDEAALKMATDYMISMKDILQTANAQHQGGGPGGHRHGPGRGRGRHFDRHSDPGNGGWSGRGREPGWKRDRQDDAWDSED